jgi:hypothetical protein
MGWRSQLLLPNLSGLKLEFQPENLQAPSEDPILQSQTTGIRIQRIDPPYCVIVNINWCFLYELLKEKLGPSILFAEKCQYLRSGLMDFRSKTSFGSAGKF